MEWPCCRVSSILQRIAWVLLFWLLPFKQTLYKQQIRVKQIRDLNVVSARVGQNHTSIYIYIYIYIYGAHVRTIFIFLMTNFWYFYSLQFYTVYDINICVRFIRREILSRHSPGVPKGLTRHNSRQQLWALTVTFRGTHWKCLRGWLLLTCPPGQASPSLPYP